MILKTLSGSTCLAFLLLSQSWLTWAEASNSSLTVSNTSLAGPFRPGIAENLRLSNIPNPTRWPEAGMTTHLYLTVIRKAWTSSIDPIQTSSYSDLAVPGMRVQLIVIPGVHFIMEQLGWACFTMLQYGLTHPTSPTSSTCAISRWSISRNRDGKVLGQAQVIWEPEASSALPETPANLQEGRNASTYGSVKNSFNDTITIPSAISATISTTIHITSSGQIAPNRMALRLITKMIQAIIVRRWCQDEAEDFYNLGEAISVTEDGYTLCIKFQNFMPEGFPLNMGHIEEVLRALTLRSELRRFPVTFKAIAYAWNDWHGRPGRPFITVYFEKDDDLPRTLSQELYSSS